MTNIRSIGDGSWYWVNKAILRDYAKDIGALGIAVYSCLASFVDGNQSCYPTQDKIAEILGYSRTSINKTIAVLEKHGLIAIDKRGRHNCIYHLRQVPKARCKASERQMLSIATLDVKYSHTNENQRSRTNNNNVAIDEIIHRGDRNDLEGLKPAITNEVFAVELAEALNDHKNLACYISCCRKYPESLLRGVIREVLETPASKIRKSRAALFIHLIKTYANKPSDHLSH